ncbi:MAG: tRNA pseudouridine synthase A [Gemmatimonadota bacterium]
METGAWIRLQLTVHYDGSGFHGWQFQPDQRTVQGELEAALSRLADRPRTVVGSGRTDAGVHATGQVASVDMPPKWVPDALHRALNAVLPPDIWVKDVHRVQKDFHPRYDAQRRSYEYRVGIAAECRSPFHRPWCWALGEPLDAELLHQGAAHLEGNHSFLAFAKAGQPERGDRCTIHAAAWDRWALGRSFHVTADRYLHHMVRYLVGTMVDVARGRRPLDDIPALLRAEGGVETSPPAPPEGLFLTRVEYPEHVRLPDEETGAATPPETRSTAPR